ncbi:MAG: hypothetical protein K8R09_01590 [Desulfobacterales bacterium]|nr:hypothetical protein [Desulfobacterales bacterium]
MDNLTKDDLAQIDRTYLQSLEKETVIDVACKLRDFSVALVERLEQNSSNSSKPPSSDNPYDKGNKGKSDSKDDDAKNSSAEDKENKTTEKGASAESSQSDDSNRSAGRQPGSQGFWRSETPIPESAIPHYPSICVICGKGLDVPEGSLPYMGYYVYELEKTASGIRISCTLHRYYTAVCDCGHETKAQPGEGFISRVEGRKKDLKLTEYTMVGPMLATFIATLSVRFRMSRVKIKEFLSYWLSTELSVGTHSRGWRGLLSGC